MKVQSAVDSIGVDKRLTFTYVNAGYLKLGYGTVITFSDSRQRGRYDRMRIQRFSINENDTLAGVFGNTGRKNPYETSLSGASLYVRERKKQPNCSRPTMLNTHNSLPSMAADV